MSMSRQLWNILHFIEFFHIEGPFGFLIFSNIEDMEAVRCRSRAFSICFYGIVLTLQKLNDWCSTTVTVSRKVSENGPKMRVETV